jgi:putative chitinase
MRTFAVSAVMLVAGGVLAGDSSAKPNGPPALSAAQLKAIMPKLTDEGAGKFLQPLNDAMKEFGITTPQRRAAFLAQVAHESGDLRYMEEPIATMNYEGRADLGNTQPGDGKRYKPRGPLQLTGRANYRAAGRALKLDLENQPELVIKPEIGCRVAAWYWKAQGLNELADAGDFRQITQRVSSGRNGYEQRLKTYRRAKEVLGIRS